MQAERTPHVYSHRDFWTEGFRAGGLDRSILTIHDRIAFDNGETMPSFATWAYRGDQCAPFPLRQLTDAQAARLDQLLGQRNFRVVGDSPGCVHGQFTYGHYAPRSVDVFADGRVEVGL